MITLDTFVQDMAAAMPKAYVDYWMDRLAMITPRTLMPSTRREAQAAVVEAQRAGLGDVEQISVLINTIAFRRLMWFPEQVASLVAHGFLVDEGPAGRLPGRRWYVPAETPELCEGCGKPRWRCTCAPKK